jgi:hypothetical protein
MDWGTMTMLVMTMRRMTKTSARITNSMMGIGTLLFSVGG